MNNFFNTSSHCPKLLQLIWGQATYALAALKASVHKFMWAIQTKWKTRQRQLLSQFSKAFLNGNKNRQILFSTSCGTRPSDGLPHLSSSLSTRFLKPLFSPVVPDVVPLCKCATHSLPFQCLRSLLPLGSVGKMDNFLAFWAPVELPEEIIIDFGYLS